MAPFESAAGSKTCVTTNVESLNSGRGGPKNRLERLSWGEQGQGGLKPMHARLYRLALVAGVVAVFLEGLGATWKWS